MMNRIKRSFIVIVTCVGLIGEANGSYAQPTPTQAVSPVDAPATIPEPDVKDKMTMGTLEGILQSIADLQEQLKT